MKKIGLYFGTFNPIHVGHLIIANYMADYTDLDEIWLIVSPQNPLKKKESLLADYHRLSLVRVGIQNNIKLQASDVEFNLTKPSYTVHTLIHLKEKHPNYQFNLIMGADNLRSFHKWKNHEEIIKEHHIYVYPRILTEQEITNKATQISPVFDHENIIHCDAPMMKISSSFIRKAIKNKKDVQYLLTEPVYKYVDEMNFYK
jgi:nicotinate-nucleotide adenylyltransferase